MYALRLILGVAFVAIQGVALTWAAVTAPVHASSEVTKEGDKYIEVITTEISANVDARVVAETRNGAIEVRSWDKPTVRIAATKTMKTNGGGWFIFGGGDPFNDEAEALAYFERLKLEFLEENPAEVGVKAEFPKSQKRRVNFSVSYVIDVPAGATLNLKTSNGAIRASDVGGDVLADTSNGAVELKNIGGSAKAASSNGKVSCEHAGGDVDLRTSNGAVHLARNAPLTPNTKISCRTSNGGIQVRLPRGSAFDLEAKTSNGNISSDFPLPGEPGKPLTRVETAVSGGGADVSLRTSNGAITLLN